MPQFSTYKAIFFAANGFGPYRCCFCEGKVTFDDLVHRPHADHIHHMNEDRFDHSPDNLVAAHRGCHLSHHAANRPPGHREKVSAALKGREVSTETRAKLSRAQTGRRHTVETKRKMSEVARDRNKA